MAQVTRAAGTAGVMYRDADGNLLFVGPAPLPPLSHIEITPEKLDGLLKDVEMLRKREDNAFDLADLAMKWIPRLVAQVQWLDSLREYHTKTESMLLDREATLKAIARIDGVREMVELTLKEESTPEYQSALAEAARDNLGIQKFDTSDITGTDSDEEAKELMGEVSNDPQIEPAPRPQSAKDAALKKVQDYIHQNPSLVGGSIAQKDLFSLLDEVEKLEPDQVFPFLDSYFKKEQANG